MNQTQTYLSQIQRRNTQYLKKSHGIGDAVSRPTGTGDTNLVLSNRSLILRLRNALIHVHLNNNTQKSEEPFSETNSFTKVDTKLIQNRLFL